MGERTYWFLISPLQMIPWTWLNIWLIQLSHSSHQIFTFTKTNQTHFITPPTISLARSFTCNAEIANKRDQQKRSRAWARDPPILSGMEMALRHEKLTDHLCMHSLSNTLRPHPTSCDEHLPGLPKIFHWTIKKSDQQSKQHKGGWAWRRGDTSSATWAVLCMSQEHQIWCDCTKSTSSVVLRSQMIQ